MDFPTTSEEITDKIRNKATSQMSWIAGFIDEISKTQRSVPLTQRECLSAGFTSSDINKLVKLNLVDKKILRLRSSNDPNKGDTVCAILPTALGRKFIKELKKEIINESASTGTDQQG